MEPTIQVQNLSKIYRLYGRPWNRIREKFPWNKDRRFHREVVALRNLDFSVASGQCLGVVGANGAGKSTLLKILTGTTVPSAGSYTLRGQIASLLELGAGFHPEFTGTENILMNAAMLGIPRREAKKRVGAIAEFSELGEFLDAPLRTYSSGMVCRLGFSVAVATDPEILILDEILSVGDMAFQKKCIQKIWDYKTRGKTLLFCSHSLYHLRQICEEVIWLRKGELVMHGDSITVTNEYATYETQNRGVPEHMPWDAGEEGAGDVAPEQPAIVEPGEDHPHIVEALLVDPRTGRAQNTFKPGDSVMVKVRIKNSRVPEKLALAIGFLRTDGTLCFAPTTEMDGVAINFAEGTVTLLLKGVRLLSGEFSVPVWLLDYKGLHRYHEKPTTENLVIQNRDRELGLFVQDREWQVEPSGATVQGRVAPKK